MFATLRRRLGMIAGLVVLAGSTAASVVYAEADPAKAAYLKYCSACHGESGKGDGVVSGFMQPRPTDLTQLAKKAGGQFPTMQVVESIDGTKTVRAHGDTDMPVWGELFHRQVPAPLTGDGHVRGTELQITEYLRSIQAQ